MARKGVGEGQAPANTITRTRTFKYQRNAVDFKVGDGSLKFELVRQWPWSIAHADILVAIRVASEAQPVVLPVVIPGLLTRSDSNPPIAIQGTSLSGTLTGLSNPKTDASTPRIPVRSVR